MPFGPIKHTYVILHPEFNLQWGTTPVQYLGIKITPNKDELITLNYDPIVDTISLLTNIWKQRDLTIFGKVSSCVANNIFIVCFTQSSSCIF